MNRICLCLPTNRACPATITAVHREAAYAADRFGADVQLLILDSSDARTRAEHARVAAALPRAAGVTVHHLDERSQRAFLRRAIARTGLPGPDRLLGLLLPPGVSYGSCTDRAFLLAAALGCHSVHRRDSDSTYQLLDGEPVHPVHHELPWLGRPAAEASAAVTRTDLDPAHAHRPVSMAGASFIGELSVDIGEIRHLDEGVYHDVVGLWAPADASPEQRCALVEESFTGAGTAPFTGDHSTLTLVDPMRVDMCNIAFHRDVYERIPLPPATDTIGSDYFLIHLVHDATLPGILHNRHIENFYTPERRTDAGFSAYQTRFVKFLLSMLHFHHVYDRMTAEGPRLLDDRQHVRADRIVAFLRDSTWLDPAENVWRLDRLDTGYRKLGGRYEEFAEHLAGRRERLLAEARRDIEDFALLVEAWPALVDAARRTGLGPGGR
ncbi:hypothetical protein J2Z21_001144 [Streptomyces griseochromogenes]|uniref:Uncharacterized protein n=1 Tax=Streptomyces griseochromogenes TaxID=68214 RepID=A0A1B1AUD3_9ACTN|nr:DUF6271 family protein [Streptomyces griseochromogenes]ANP50145.1 hypothetical protein AVL59_11445 [Streptomyces griseochromogenes]MBP2048220.1 hypothetical protein [Streptomyces griseochromogenes]